MIVGALLARNEAAPDRYLRRAIKNAKIFCDKIVVVDDASTDATFQICEEFGAAVRSGASDHWWGTDETTARAALWGLAAGVAGPDGWIYIFDADHELIGITPNAVRTLCTADHANAWAFPLYDCWDSDETMRTDGFWQAHLHPRPWLVKARPHEGYDPDWGDPRAIHAGHIPHNYPLRVANASEGAAIRHLGYINEEHRKAKHARYLAVA